MEFGVLAYVIDSGIWPGKLARAVEERGIGTLLVPDHTHIPVEGTDTPDYAMNTTVYSRFMDPFVALTSAAATTTTLEIAPILLVPQREPIALAKAIASLDFVCGGRLKVAVGSAWHEREMRNHGVDPKTRFRRVAEYVLVMREIWANEIAEFHGDFVDFGPMMSWPKPIAGRVPLMTAGYGPKVIDRVLHWGDGWFPSALGPAENLRAFAPRFAEFRHRAEEHGRSELKLWLLSEHHDDDHIEAMLELGVDKAVFAITPGDEADTLRRLDEIAAGIARRT